MNDYHSIKKNTVLFIFLSIFLIKGIFYAVYITPPLLNTSPDDVGHISYIQYIASEKKLPILYETAFEDSSNKLYKAYGEDQELSSYKDILVHKETFNNKSVNGIAQHPPLYYLLMAPVYLIIKLFTSKLYLIILVLRLATIPFGLASIFLLTGFGQIVHHLQHESGFADARLSAD
ncbi:MAG TPA: hypothetical protein PKG96_08250 [Bacilli bacterium]|nr:hypothetical protein [Bacilli bacterium]